MIFGKYINRYYLKYSWVLLIGIASLVMVDSVQLIVPELYRITLNGIIYGETEINGVMREFSMDILLNNVCLPLLFVILALVIGRFVWRICFFGSAIRTETGLRSLMFDRCKELSQQFYNENKVGGMMSLFTNDLETVQDCFGGGVLMAADAALLGVLAVFKMARMNVWLTLFALIPMLLLGAVGTVVGKTMTKRWDSRQEAFSKLSDFSQESFSGISVIKAFVRETKELMAFAWLNRNNEKANVDYVRISVLLNILVTLFVESVICIIFGYGGYLVLDPASSFNVGRLVEFAGYFTSVIWPIMAVAELIDMSSRGKASLKRITALIDAGVDVADRPDVADPGEIRGEIEFRGLSFTYPGASSPSLHDVSFRINAGESVGIIGKTGSGKTTIADLILRQYNVDDGMIFIDGHDINSIPLDVIRKYTAYVPQDNFLFSDTIERNIAFALDDYSEEEVEEAAAYAGVHDDISEFPEKYKTVLGERGVTVSGGQKQRISIARALMKDASVIIMDDAVSAVDTKTEERILDALHTVRAGKTTVMIAHRVSTVEDMDKIIYVDDGTVTAVGTHEQLYGTCEAYRKTVELQKLEEERRDDLNA
ncbi:MAG: ABC transporter ATP-binding protein [Clostridia bacterium]|nr:ABC transporter ATP-binding protein [Clostridia bacterium]